MKPSRKDFEVNYLVELAMEGSITPEQSQLLNQLIVEDAALCRHYCEYVQMTVLIERLNAKIPATDLFENEMVFDENLWNQLALAEQIAPEIEIPAVSKKSQEDEKPAEIKKVHPKVSKFSVFSLVVSSAALLFVIVYTHFVSMRHGIVVATLTDCLNAKWMDDTTPMTKGTRIETGNKRFLLREGYAEMLFDNQARVVLEGPVEFQILAEDRIALNYGKVYVTVPKGAIGFTVNTPSARIIDLGTEFGVQTDTFGDVQMHVIKGKTTLIAGDRSNRINVEVNQGQAKKVSGTTLEVSDIPFKTHLFIRSINSSRNIVWRGQTELNLADMAGGGNGLGTGRIGVWLNLKTGEEGTDLIVNPQLQSQFSSEELGNMEKRTTDNRYKKASQLPYVDGIFSPDGGMGAVQVDSRGDLWSDCPDTSGVYFEDIFNGSHIATSYAHDLILNNTTYGTQERPAIALHSNAGITFDLDAIRADMPGVKITRFKSLCGVSQEAGTRTRRMDFYVLVDGKKRFESLNMNADSGPREIAVPLSREDRFLTLVATDGDLNPSCDWGFFAMPRLEIENTQ
jgi:hypothetical protein